jgi:hypothetical protein
LSLAVGSSTGFGLESALLRVGRIGTGGGSTAAELGAADDEVGVTVRVADGVVSFGLAASGAGAASLAGVVVSVRAAGGAFTATGATGSTGLESGAGFAFAFAAEGGAGTGMPLPSPFFAGGSDFTIAVTGDSGG